MTTDEWRGCYGDGWKGIMGNEEAFTHPAKFSCALIRKIYEHAMAEGWISPGDTVLDQFGGIGAGAIDAMRLKINWVGVELERHFFDIANGVDCTGITKADWIRFHKRPDKARYLDGRHWCPRCVAQIARVENGSSNLELFDLPDSAAYVRNSGKIPSVAPHHYVGNIEAWKAKTNFAGAKMLNGDSRRLREVLREEAACCVSSPPFSPVGNQMAGGHQGVRKDYREGKCKANNPDSTYGDHPAQLGAMREGEFSAAISSPPYTQSIHDGNGIDADKLTGNPAGKNSQAFMRGYGKSDGQLGDMREGEFSAAISSPVYADGAKHTGGTDAKSENIRGGELHYVHYGESGSQLGAMPEGQFTASISSSPFLKNADGGVRGDKFADPVAFAKKMSRRDDGKNNRHQVTERARIAQFERENTRVYGNSDGQLGTMAEGKFDASVSSPPYEASIHDPATRTIEHKADLLEAAGYDAKKWLGNKRCSQMRNRGYGNEDGQIGAESGETFWSAARQIVEETYAVLKPGGHAIWVTKRYIKNGKIVEFSRQWAKLCEAVGFRLVCWHRALLEEDYGTQADLLGNDKQTTRARKSFFRRLAEKNGSPKIDWEDVICMMKD